MRKVQSIFPTGSAAQGRSFVKGLLDKMGTSGSIYPVKDQRIQRAQNYLLALKEQRLVAPFASKRGGLVLLLLLISFGLGARLWFRRQRQGKQPPVSSRTQGKQVPISSGTYGILIFLAFLLGLGIGARGWFRQRLQTERLAISFANKRGTFAFLALFRSPVVDKHESATEYTMATPFQSQFSAYAPTIVDAKSTPMVASLLDSPVVEKPEPAGTLVPTPFQEQPGVVASAAIETHDEDTVKMPRSPIVEKPESGDEDTVKLARPPVVSDPALVDEDTITRPRPSPPIITEPVSTPVVTPARRQPQVERSPISFMRTGVILLILFVLLIGLGVVIVPRLHTLTPVPIGHLSTPTAVVRPPTSTPIPTPIPTAGSVLYPTLAGKYSGTIYDVATNTGTSMSLTQIQQNQGKISGYLSLGSKLKGNGPFSGTIDTAHHIRFVVTDATGRETLFFDGAMQSATGLSGNFYRCIQVQGNQCSRDPSGGYGLWNVVLAS